MGQFLTKHRKTRTIAAILKQVLSNKTLEGWEIIEEPETKPNSDLELEEGEILKTIKESLDKELPDLLELDKDAIEIVILLGNN